MELILPETIKISNTILLSQELRHAIPWHSDRALVFHSIHDAPAVHWLTNQLRAQDKVLSHETDMLNSKFNLTLNPDPPTMRALGPFFSDLADHSGIEPSLTRRLKDKG